MRIIRSNKRPVWYAKYTGDQEELDAYGYHTGRQAPVYTTPQLTYCNVSGTRYDTVFASEGIQSDYHRTIMTCNKDLGWDENTVLWIDRDPTITENGVTTPVPHNYAVVGVSDTMNSITYRIREVTIS